MEDIYLITGAAGHLGSTIVRKLLQDNKKMRILVMSGEKNIPQGNLEVFYGDVCNKACLYDFFKIGNNEQAIVIHCAGIVSIASRYNEKVYQTNVIGTKNVVDICKEINLKKLIYVSSVHAIPENYNSNIITETEEFDPDIVVGLYAKTKAQATKYVLDATVAGLNACVVHPSGIVGPYDNGNGHLTTLVIDFCNKSLSAVIKGGYDFVDVRDVANGIISCIEKGRKGECYILSNKYFEVKEITDILHEITGIKKINTVLPSWFVKLTAPLAEFYYRILKQTPLYTSYSIYTLNTNSNFSHDKANKELGYTTTDIKKTLYDTLVFLKEQNRIDKSINLE